MFSICSAKSRASDKDLPVQWSATMKLLAILLCLVQFTIIKSQPIEKDNVEQCEYIEVTGDSISENFF